MNVKTNSKFLDLTTYSPEETGIKSSILSLALWGAMNGTTNLKDVINQRLNGCLDTFKKEVGLLGFELVQLDDNRKSYNVLASTISQCTHERVGYQGNKLGLQTVKKGGVVVSVTCGHAKKRVKTKSKTLTKAMMGTADMIVDGRDYGDMMDLLAQFCEYAQISSDDLEVLATMVG